MKNYFFIVLVVLYYFNANSQQLTQTIKGRIVDEQSKSGVIGATVLVKESDPLLGGTTDVDGYFNISNVPIGRQTIIISSVGYETKSVPELMLGTGKEVVINVELIEDLVEMEEVMVIAENQAKGQPVNEIATVSAISLSVEETGRYAATFDDPARAALSQAGVTGGEDDLLNEIVIRGNSPRGLLWRLEGVEIPNPNHFGDIGSSAGGISMLSGNVLSNSDFFTGAFPAQYGNATSGIFDLNLRQGNFDKHEHAFQVGLLGIAAASEGPISKNSRASYVANYRYSTLALFDKMGLEILGEQEDVAFQDLSFKVHLPTDRAGSFSIWGLGGHNSYGYKPNAEVGDWWHEANYQYMGIGGVTHVAYLNENTFIESIVSGSGYSIENLVDSLYERMDEEELFIETAFRVSSLINHKFNARNTLRVGGIFSYLGYDMKSEEWDYDQLKMITYLNDDGSQPMYQGFANWQFRLNESLTINSGLHVTHFGLNKDTYVEPRLGFRTRLNNGHSITGGLGLHSRKESLALYMAQEPQEDGGFIQHNTHLSFTKAAHAVLGYEAMIRDDLRFKTEVYYQHLYDVPIWGTDTTTSDYLLSFSILNTTDGFTDSKLSNDGTGRNYGIEVTLEKFFTRGYYFMATGSLFESKYKGLDEIERNTRYNSNFILNLVGGKEIKLGNGGNNILGLNGRMIFAGGKREAPILLEESREQGWTVFDYSRNFEQQLDNYLRFDIGISYRMNKPKYASIVAVNVQNTFARKNEYGRWYSSYTDSIQSDTQTGIFPNLSYRIEF